MNSSNTGCLDWLKHFNICGRKTTTTTTTHEEAVVVVNDTKQAIESTMNHPPQNNDRDENIDRFIEEMMESDGINQAWIPDYIERKLYRNILKTVHAHLEQLARSARIEVAGMRVTFVVET